MGEIIKGRNIAEQIYCDCREELDDLLQQFGVPPRLVIATAGYEKLKEREIALHVDVAQKLGIASTAVVLGEDASEEDLITAIQDANADTSVHGILVLLPLPDCFDQEKILHTIAPEKEMEGLLEADGDRSLPVEKQASTMAAVLALLKEVGFNIVSERAALIIEDQILEGNYIVSKLVDLAEKLNLPLEVVRSSDPEAKAITGKADVVLVSVSTPDCIDATFIKEGAVVIDFNPIVIGEEYSEVKKQVVPILRSGVDIDSALSRARYVAPALGGIGPIALAMMMKNFVVNYRALLESSVST